MIRVKIQENAAQMLKTHVEELPNCLLSKIRGSQYYMLDGKIWMIDADGIVYRAEQEESCFLHDMLREYEDLQFNLKQSDDLLEKVSTSDAPFKPPALLKIDIDALLKQHGRDV